MKGRITDTLTEIKWYGVSQVIFVIRNEKTHLYYFKELTVFHGPYLSGLGTIPKTLLFLSYVYKALPAEHPYSFSLSMPHLASPFLYLSPSFS